MGTASACPLENVAHKPLATKSRGYSCPTAEADWIILRDRPSEFEVESHPLEGTKVDGRCVKVGNTGTGIFDATASGDPYELYTLLFFHLFVIDSQPCAISGNLREVDIRLINICLNMGR